MDIIDNIITYSPYSPYNVTMTLANDSAVSLSRGTDGKSRDQYTLLTLAEVLVT